MVPDWQRVILKLYENQQREMNVSLQMGGTAKGRRGHTIASEMDIERSELEDAVEFMHATGLVFAESRGKKFKITPKGFEVAHEIRMQQLQQEQEDTRARRQQKVNMGVGFLTVGLLIANLLSPLIVASGWESPIPVGFIVGIDVIAIAVVLYYLVDSGLLSPDLVDETASEQGE